jgi:peptidoglycan/xylan/chitin deacetylase (PgdA/CDA1 family)
VAARTNARPTLRALLRWGWICVLRYSGCIALARRWIGTHGAVVLTFHRILPEAAANTTLSPAGMVVNQSTFESLLRYIKQNHSLLDLRKEPPPQGAHSVQIAITFDDGWEDTASIAFPIASKLGVPFTVFVCPGLMDKSIPFWPEFLAGVVRAVDTSAEIMDRACHVLTSAGCGDWIQILTDRRVDRADALIQRCKNLAAGERNRLLQALATDEGPAVDDAASPMDRTMSWPQLNCLAEASVSFGSHTQNHEILNQLSLAEAEHQLTQSKAMLERHVGTCDLFSYPNGDWSTAARAVVEHSGYRLAFINSPGIWKSGGDPFSIPRINLADYSLTDWHGRFSPAAFEYRVFWQTFVHPRKTGKQRARQFDALQMLVTASGKPLLKNSSLDGRVPKTHS